MLLFTPLANRVTTIMHLLRAEYNMTDFGPIRCFLCIEIERDRSRRILHIHQKRAVRKLLVTNSFSDCNGHWTPQPTESKLQRSDPESNPTNGTAETVDSDAGPRIHHLHAQQILLHPDYRALVSSHLYLTISATHGQTRYPVQCIRLRRHHARRLHRLRLRRSLPSSRSRSSRSSRPDTSLPAPSSDSTSLPTSVAEGKSNTAWLYPRRRGPGSRTGVSSSRFSFVVWQYV